MTKCYIIGNQRLTKTHHLLRIEKIIRLYNSLLWGSGLCPDAVCKDPPTALHRLYEKHPLKKRNMQGDVR